MNSSGVNPSSKGSVRIVVDVAKDAGDLKDAAPNGFRPTGSDDKGIDFDKAVPRSSDTKGRTPKIKAAVTIHVYHNSKDERNIHLPDLQSDVHMTTPVATPALDNDENSV